MVGCGLTNLWVNHEPYQKKKVLEHLGCWRFKRDEVCVCVCEGDGEKQHTKYE